MHAMRFLTQGETGIVVEFGDKIDLVLNKMVHRVSRRIVKDYGQFVEAVVPTYRSLMIIFDPLMISRQALIDKIVVIVTTIGEELNEATVAKAVNIPTLYGGEEGPDLEFVANYNNLAAEEVIQIHSSVAYRIYMIGFTPGFPYLGGLSERIAAPRLKTPRTRIPAGSVGIAGAQTGLYPVESPGGWQLIGRTPLRVFDPRRERPFLYEAGDYLKFVSISVAEYSLIAKDIETGRYQPETMLMRDEGK